MSNAEVRPRVELCDSAASASGRIEIIPPRDVPLGGLRAMNVRRTLPARERSLIGAWCFLDHYGPDQIAETGGMTVTPHPHTGLATVSWLFAGEIEHRDSAGNHAMVLPGEVNLMTAGKGISHSEISTQSRQVLHGAQLWFALPDKDRFCEPSFAHHVPRPVTGRGWSARVFLGSLLGDRSPVATPTPLLGAELVLEPGAVATFEVSPWFEHGILVDEGSLTWSAHADADPGAVARAADTSASVAKDQLAYLAPGYTSFTVTAGFSRTRILLLGGTPLGEQIVMWWNFIGRTHDEIVQFRAEWQAQIRDAEGRIVPDSQEVADGRFGRVVGDRTPPIPAPELPKGVRLKLRG